MTTISEGDAYRLAEACSFEDNETVQELWAGLITSTIRSDKEVTMTRAFIEILKAIGPVEKELL
ncbi:MAG: Abi-alpha family protein [Gammaproteobacteria bacterium]|nr:Abi-alpha family protein [Gammaproteobacteria bacterium]MDE0512520.1 Abi-alpha family protein [Gammaproteobacteria bacterium]